MNSVFHKYFYMPIFTTKVIYVSPKHNLAQFSKQYKSIKEKASNNNMDFIYKEERNECFIKLPTNLSGIFSVLVNVIFTWMSKEMLCMMLSFFKREEPYPRMSHTGLVTCFNLFWILRMQIKMSTDILFKLFLLLMIKRISL